MSLKGNNMTYSRLRRRLGRMLEPFTNQTSKQTHRQGEKSILWPLKMNEMANNMAIWWGRAEGGEKSSQQRKHSSHQPAAHRDGRWIVTGWCYQQTDRRMNNIYRHRLQCYICVILREKHQWRIGGSEFYLFGGHLVLVIGGVFDIKISDK